jgi:hypothetical protein
MPCRASGSIEFEDAETTDTGIDWRGRLSVECELDPYGEDWHDPREPSLDFRTALACDRNRCWRAEGIKSYEDCVAVLHAMAALRAAGAASAGAAVAAWHNSAAPALREGARSWLRTVAWEGDEKDAVAFEALCEKAMALLME